MGQVRRDAQVFAQFSGNSQHVAHTLKRRVTVFLDQRAVRFGKLREVWRVDDQLAAFLDDRTKLVAGLAPNPQFIVMRIEQRDYSLVLSIGVTNVNLSTHFGRASKRLA